jgi:hypothetical protein
MTSNSRVGAWQSTVHSANRRSVFRTTVVARNGRSSGPSRPRRSDASTGLQFSSGSEKGVFHQYRPKTDTMRAWRRHLVGALGGMVPRFETVHRVPDRISVLRRCKTVLARSTQQLTHARVVPRRYVCLLCRARRGLAPQMSAVRTLSFVPLQRTPRRAVAQLRHPGGLSFAQKLRRTTTLRRLCERMPIASRIRN